MSTGNAAPDLRALAEAATPGPWSETHITAPNSRVGGTSTFAMVNSDSASAGYLHSVADCAGNVANARFIAACSPDAILALLTCAEQAENATADLRNRAAILYAAAEASWLKERNAWRARAERAEEALARAESVDLFSFAYAVAQRVYSACEQAEGFQVGASDWSVSLRQIARESTDALSPSPETEQ